MLPSLLGFLVFVILAVMMSLGMSFTSWGLTGFKSFVGLNNYQALLHDPVFWQAFRNTAFYLVTIVPLQLALGLAMALALNQGLRATGVYRLIYFMPVVTTVVAGAIVFRLLLGNTGLVNVLIQNFAELTGLPVTPPNWLGSTRYAKLGRGDPDPVEKHRLHHGDLPGRAARGAAGAVRRRPRGRRGRLAAAAPRHAAHDQRHHLFSLRLSVHRRFPALHRAFRHDPRRAGQLVAQRGAVHLSGCVPRHPHGQGRGHGLVPVHLYLCVHADPEPSATALGLLRDRVTWPRYVPDRSAGWLCTRS
ncbi:MAG: sugar ABC transporter permease [Anaerolineae bacterium]